MVLSDKLKNIYVFYLKNAYLVFDNQLKNYVGNYVSTDITLKNYQSMRTLYLVNFSNNIYINLNYKKEKLNDFFLDLKLIESEEFVGLKYDFDETINDIVNITSVSNFDILTSEAYLEKLEYRISLYEEHF